MDQQRKQHPGWLHGPGHLAVIGTLASVSELMSQYGYAVSVMFAFRKDDDLRKLDRTSKVGSILSLTVFGSLVLFGAIGIIQSLWL